MWEVSVSWVNNELNGIDLGDKRLNKRSVKILESLGGSPSESIPSACNGFHETKAAYRFFDNKGVTDTTILMPHKEATLRRLANEKVVLCLQDTTELDLSGQKANGGLGYLNHDARRGLYLHPTLAVTPNRICLGAIHIHTWKRDKLKKHKTAEELKAEHPVPIEDKESYRWIESYAAACDVAAQFPEKTIVSVGDRECDMYEFFLEAEKRKKRGEASAEWLIRSRHQRMLDSDMDQEGSDECLREAAHKAPIVGHIEFTLQSRNKKPARKIKQTVQVIRRKIRPPSSLDTTTEPIEVTAILTKEVNAPKGEAPVEWLLLTSIELTEDKMASEIIQWYLARWEIEVYFKILKSGCKIEKLQLETKERMTACLAIYMIVAWRILYVTMMGRQGPDLPCSVVFHEYEWRAAYEVSTKKKSPEMPITLNDMLKLVASLGGHLNRKGDGQPGAKKMWIGMQRLRDFSIAWEATRGIYG